MKRIFKPTLLLALFTLIATQAFAQRPMDRRGDRGRTPGDPQMRMMNVPPEVRSEIHIAVFDEYLSLTDDQKKQLEVVDADFAEKLTVLRDEKINRRKKSDKMKTIQNEHQQAIHKVLTKDQYSVYLDKREAIRYDIRQRLNAYSDENGK